MIERITDKQKPCTYCTQYGHTAFKCPKRPRPALKPKSRLKTTKPINKRGPVAKQWTKTRSEFMKSLGTAQLICHYCRKPVAANECEIDHMESRTRRPDLRFSKDNLVVSCHVCNTAKGSRSHDEFCLYCKV